MERTIEIKKNDVYLHILIWKGLYEILLSAEKNSKEDILCCCKVHLW